MSHFAQVIDGIVTQVIVAEQDFINSGAVGDPSQWIQTSYNTIGGEHRNGGTPLRKNYAGIGYSYDAGRDAFVPPKPFASWVLDEATCWWKAPTDMPAITPPTTEADGQGWQWDEETTSWKSTVLPKLSA
jgi:hypothetical protein